MARTRWLKPLVVVLLASVATGARCPWDDPAPAEVLKGWASRWVGNVKSDRRFPNHLSIPAPPRVDLGASAQGIGDDVYRSAVDLSGEVDVVDYSEAKKVYCYWFAWYMKTGEPLPSEEEFPDFLLRYGFGRVLRSPPNQQLRDAAELFRSSVDRAQNEPEAVVNGAIAAVCSIPDGPASG